jgi:hypothetical protein
MPLAKDGDYPEPGLPVPGADDQELPSALEKEPQVGTEPIFDPRDLAHPQPKQQEQAAISLT